MAISFGGLATGIDTSSLIDSLMEMERQPINRLTVKMSDETSRLNALTSLNDALTSLLTKVKDLDSTEDFNAFKVDVTGEPLVNATAASSAMPGSYSIQAHAMAQVEKDVSQGFASMSEKSFGTGVLTLTVGTTDPVSYDITIDENNNSLTGLAEAINASGSGIRASIINDGTGTPYRLMLVGAKAGTPEKVGFTLDTSALTGGTYATPVFTETQPAQQAHVTIDTIDMYSDSNTFTEAIPGVTLNLAKADLGATTANLTIATDDSKISSKFQAFVNSYNQIMSFVSKQSSKDGQAAGQLVGDSGMNSIKQRLQNLLTTRFDTGGTFQSLADLGLKTQKDGTLKFDSTVFTKALNNDRKGLTDLLTGNETTGGISAQFRDYLESLTDTRSGFLVGRKETINRNIRSMNDQISLIERRLEQRELTLVKQFTALENLVSGMNAQSNYLTQQMDMLNNLWSQK